MRDSGCTGQVQFSRCLFCGLHNLVLFRPMPHANKMIGFEIWNYWFLQKTKFVRQTYRFHSLDWRFHAIRKKVVCCLLPKRLQNLKIRKWTIFRIFGFCPKWIYTSVNVITDCDSVETQKGRYFVWNWLTVSCIISWCHEIKTILFYQWNISF